MIFVPSDKELIEFIKELKKSNERQEKINQNISIMTRFVLFLTFINVTVFILDYLKIPPEQSLGPGLFISAVIAIIFFLNDILFWFKSLFNDGGPKMFLKRIKFIIKDVFLEYGMVTVILLFFTLLTIFLQSINKISLELSFICVGLFITTASFTYAVRQSEKSKIYTDNLDVINAKLDLILKKKKK